MSISFPAALQQSNWDEQLGAWRCPALLIPGAAIEAIYAAGTRLNSDYYLQMKDLEHIKWSSKGDPPTHNVTVVVTLKDALTKKKTTSVWKAAALVQPIVLALIAGWLQRHPPVDPGAKQLWSIEGSVVTEDANGNLNDVILTTQPPMQSRMPNGDFVVADVPVSSTGTPYLSAYKDGYRNETVTLSANPPYGQPKNYHVKFDTESHRIQIPDRIVLARAAPYNPPAPKPAALAGTPVPAMPAPLPVDMNTLVGPTQPAAVNPLHPATPAAPGEMP